MLYIAFICSISECQQDTAWKVFVSFSGPYFPAFGNTQIRENTDQNNSEYGHSSRSETSSSFVYKITSLSIKAKLIFFNVMWTREDFSSANWTLHLLNVTLGRVWMIRSLALNLSWRNSVSYRNQSIDLICKSMDWFLYDRKLRHERV